MTLSDMAREIERRRPKSLHNTIDVGNETLLVFGGDGYDDAPPIALHPSVAAAILRDAMVMATRAARIAGGWTVPVVPPEDQPWEDRCTFADADHGNCPTRSLFAAFCAAYPEVKP